MTKTIALLLLAAAAGNGARAQQYVSPNHSYNFTATDAIGGGTISYQWFRNGEPISGATGRDYALPDNLAYGINVEFTRSAVSNICPSNTSYTEPFTVTFCDLYIGSICWASTNVAAPNKFAPRPDKYTQFYQWNRLTAWAAAGSVTGWNSIADNTETWTVNPCPSGWRLPTREEFQALQDASHTWAVAHSARGNEIAGRFYGPSSGFCKLPDNMSGCIFLPAAGSRNSGGYLTNRGSSGLYWSNSSYIATNGYMLLFDNTSSTPNNFDGGKTNARSIRCVQ